jgi:putative phosphoribosyl transferase
MKRLIRMPIGKIFLDGELQIPAVAEALVVFSHGSGSSRFSSRNIYVANELHKKNIGTLLFDLLTRSEDELYSNRFNIELLTSRLVSVTQYLATLPECKGLQMGYFGASTGAASALRAAAQLPELIKAVVSRGGRPDLAIDSAVKVKAPTLLIVGERDYDVQGFNMEFHRALRCEKRLAIIPGASHLFEEKGALEEVAQLASEWFSIYLHENKKAPILNL